MFFRIFRSMSKLALRLFFRRIEVDGLSDVPVSGPLLLVPNHTNALVDPLIPLTVLRRRVTLTGKNVLTGNPLLALLAGGLGAVLFHRRADVGKGADPRENLRSLEKCREILAAGGALCIFPEGVSHSDLSMRPFHTGPARIALDFVGAHGKAGRLRIVPVGLHYTAKSEMRSDALLRFGDPIDVAEWVAAQGEGATVAALTEEIRRRVEGLTLEFEDRREMLAIRYASEIVATEGRMPRPLGNLEPGVAESFERLARLRAGYRSLRTEVPGEISALAARLVRYRAELRRRGIDPGEVYLPLHPARAVLFLVREVELLVIGAPLALFGAANHLVPYLTVRGLARALSTDRDHWATNVIYPSLVVFPMWYALLLALVWLRVPAPWAITYSLAVPYCGYYALLYSERAGNAWARARTFVRFVSDRGAQLRLATEGREILAAIYLMSARLQPDREASSPVAGVEGQPR